MPAPDRWALLVGIDRYPRLAERYQLAGCGNDVRALSRVLVERHGFPLENLVQLLDAAATREGILMAMEDLVQRVGEGDTVLVHYSGHGSQMPDLDGDEDDGLDETIVPSDSGRAPEPNRDIRDDEIHAWLGRLTARTPNVTLVFDCCHSGTVSRGAGRVRGVEPDLRRPAGPPTPVRRGAAGLPGGLRDLPHILLTACLAGETSHEVELGEGGESHGALTCLLVRALTAAPPDATWSGLFAAVAPEVTALYPNQHPQIEGAADRRLFGLE
ncbi:MAG TPA: caspase family protein [Thermoanaerobaculia bacterium]|nr:caspase family protein [Thermoanaerobaculia bacterium]